MENQITELVEQEKKQLATSSRPLIKQEVAIRNCPEVKLKQSLGFGIMLTGLSAQNMPSKIESAVLSQFVRDNYPDYTPEEFNYAMEKAMARRLDPDLDVKVYGSFSCEYIGRILSAYENWSIKGYNVSVSELEINGIYARFLNGELNDYHPTLMLYRKLVDEGLIAHVLSLRQSRRTYHRRRVIRAYFEYWAGQGHVALFYREGEQIKAICNDYEDSKRPKEVEY